MALCDLRYLQNLGLLTLEETRIMEDYYKTKEITPSGLIVFDCKDMHNSTTYHVNKSIFYEGMLLLLKETFLQKRFFNEGNYLKNVDGLMAYKKSCGNMIKFSTQNISPALVQVRSLIEFCFQKRNQILIGILISFI